MKKALIATAIIALSFTSFCYANTSIVDVWTCKLNPGKTMKDAGTVNEKWAKFMNAHVKGGGINSYDLSPLVGDQGHFLYVDSYPNLQSWASSEKVMENKEGKALLKEIQAIAKCSKNSLYSATKH